MDERELPLAGRQPSWDEEHAKDEFAYEMLTVRSVGTNGAQWQVPGLAIAAQAFLLTIALDPANARWPRFAAALMGLLTTYMSLQLLRRHRHYYQVDKAEIDRLSASDRLELPTRDDLKSSRSVHPRFLFGKSSSVTVWTFGLTVMMIFDVALAALAGVAPRFFGS